MDEESTWDWPLVFTAVRDLLDKNVSSNDFKRDMVLKAKQCWDSNKRNTGGRVYKAAPLSKMAESVANKAKKFFDADLSKMASSKVLQMYTSTCSTPMPRSRGWRFKDTYVTETWQPAPDSSQNDCYRDTLSFHTGRCRFATWLDNGGIEGVPCRFHRICFLSE